MKLERRGIIITGASQGLGRAIAAECIGEGADVLLCARDQAMLDHACSELASGARQGQKVLARCVDVSRRDDVGQLFETARNSLPQLHGLVNNAGVHGPKGPLEEVDVEAWCHAVEINLFGAMYACREVLPIFRRQGYGKIVNLSGGGATAPMPRMSAYAASKAAVVRLTETLAEETRGTGIDVNAVAPGALNTRLLDQILAEKPETVGPEFHARAVEQKEQGGSKMGPAAELCVFLLSSASDGITGKLISAVWDPWRDLAKRAAELSRTDVYTLRRIVPKDRGLNWERS